MHHVVGRELELHAITEFLGGSGPRALVLSGRPGIGKTTLWSAGIDAAAERGMRLLCARPSGAEAELSLTALIDLCDALDVAALDGVPAPQREALEVALLRAVPSGPPPEPRAIALGLLNALRALGAQGPVLIAIDDLQWLDAASSDALTFAARRLESEPVAFLLARRPGRPAPLEQALEHPERLTVGPLSLGATRRILAERLDLSLPRKALRRVVDSAVGNPLFALELGRTLKDGGPPAPDEDITVPDALEDMLGTRVDGLAPAVQRLLLAVALSGDLRTAEATAVDGPALDAAVDAGVLVVDGTRVRAAHPLIAAAARTRSRAADRRELHGALAEAVEDEQRGALHLALATDRPDEALAARIADAAAAASARGRREQALRLAEHALRLTPEGSPARPERLLALGAALEVAGELDRIPEVVRPALDWLPAGRQRARAYMLLSEGGDIRTPEAFERYLQLAWDEGEDDPALRSVILSKRAGDMGAWTVDRLVEAEAMALEAQAMARDAGAEEEQRFALVALGWVYALTGRSLDALCEEHRGLSESADYMVESPERVAAQQLVWRGEMDAARAELRRLLEVADERGEPVSYALQRLHLCEYHLRAGAWDAAAALLDEWAESADVELLVPPMYERCRALLAAGRGLPEVTEEWAAKAVTGAREAGVIWDQLECARARGIAALLAPDSGRAAASLRSVWEHVQREGISEPGAFPVAPDLVEALADLGETREAMAVTTRVHELAAAQNHPWGRVTASRCGAVIALAGSAYDEEAGAALEEAAADYERLGLRFDAARSWLAVGRRQRRFKQWGAARASLERAAEAFEALGSAGWAERAREELSRVGARRPRASGELTPTEERVVALAAEGLANKQIAQTLFVTVHTVEVHLSRAYQKLGVRSRSQLAARLQS